jgi:hypothetical protein
LKCSKEGEKQKRGKEEKQMRKTKGESMKKVESKRARQCSYSLLVFLFFVNDGKHAKKKEQG